MRLLLSLPEAVAATSARYRMFAPGQRVAVAVSGGADSVCLLYVLHELAPRLGLTLSVLHLDHGLRGEESRQDAEFVRGLADALGLPAEVRRAALSGAAGNLEQACRRARLEFFGEALAGGADRVALGHTRRDQAETVLFRFLRGSGAAGLSGIRPVTGSGLVRPLIETGREEIETWLRARGIAWREDSTNATLAFARNRIRHVLLPQLAREWNPRIEETLARMAEWAQDEECYWDATLPAAGPVLEAAALAAAHPAMARRMIRRAIEHAKGDLRGIDFGHTESILRLAESPEGHGSVRIPGVTVQRSFGQIRFAPSSDTAHETYRYPIPACPAAGAEGLSFPLPGAAIHVQLLEKPETTPLSDYVYNGEMSCLDRDRLSGPVELRPWRPGDRFQPAGARRPKKIKALFQLARIPVWERAGWPVLADAASVVWTRRFGASATAAAVDSSTRLLVVREAPNSESEPGGTTSNV